jgi:hypothetical protein
MLLSSCADAAIVMGKNFVGLDELQNLIRINSDIQEIPIPWRVETLEKYKDSHFLVFVPALSLIDMTLLEFGKPFFKENWFTFEAFAATRLDATWHLIQKTSVFDSGNKWWLEQKAMLNVRECVPTTAVLVFAIIVYFLKTGERLFEKEYLRTLDVCNTRQRISLAGFNTTGVHLHNWPEFDYFHIKVAAEIVPDT